MAPILRQSTLQARSEVPPSKTKLQVQLQTQRRRSPRIIKLNNPSPSLLHGLPSEIQEMILSHACDGVYVHTTHDDVEIGAVCIDANDGDDWDRWEHNKYKPHGFKALRPGLPGWMLLNKQMYADVLRHFHRHAKVFHMYTSDAPVRQKAAVFVDHMRMDRARVVNLTQWGKCYLSSWRAGEEAYVVEFHHMNERSVRRATNHLGSSTALEQLTIKFGLAEHFCRFLPEPVDNMRIRFPTVGRLPKGLHKVTLLLAHPGSGDVSFYFSEALEVVKNELRNLALSLVRTGSKCEEDNILMIHGMKILGPNELPVERPVWRFTVTSPEYQRARSFERVVLRD